LTRCGGREPYFGRLAPPPSQTLVYEIGAEPSGLDPASSLGASESYIWPALFETLVSSDPATFDPRSCIPFVDEIAPEHYAACIRIGAQQPVIDRVAKTGTGDLR